MSTIYNRHAAHTPHTTDLEHKLLLCSRDVITTFHTRSCHTYTTQTRLVHQHVLYTYTTFTNTHIEVHSHKYTHISQTYSIFRLKFSRFSFPFKPNHVTHQLPLACLFLFLTIFMDFFVSGKKNKNEQSNNNKTFFLISYK